MAKKAKRKYRGVLKHLFFTALSGLLFWAIGELLFPSLTEKMLTPLGIAIYFVIFFVLLAAVVLIISYNKADFSNPDIKRNVTSDRKLVALILCVFFLFTMLFEFLYELGKQELPEPTSLIFLVDDSGSMEGTEEERKNAIDTVMMQSGTDLPYAVYKFSDSAELIKDMGSYSPDDSSGIALESTGGTDILGSIKQVLSDIEAGSFVNGGNYPKILLVSDGSSYSSGLRKVAKSCNKKHISVSTIGVEYCDKVLLEKIARLTGGVFVYCDDVSSLAQGLKSAMATNTRRNLLSERVVFVNDGLYAFLRILFLGIMGVIWSLMKSVLCYEKAEFKKKIFLLSVALCLAAAVTMEFLTSHGIAVGYVRLVFCVLWATTSGHVERYERNRVNVLSDMPTAPDKVGAKGDGTEEKKLFSEENDDSEVSKLSFGAEKEAHQNPFESPQENPFAKDGFATTSNGFATGSNGFGEKKDGFGNNTGGFGGSSFGNSPFGK